MYRVAFILQSGETDHKDFETKDKAMDFVISKLDNLKRYRIMDLTTSEIIETDEYRRDKE